MRDKGDTILILYTLQNCIYCNWLKGKLNEENIQFREYIIDDGDMYNNLMGDSLERRYKTESYPIIEIVDQFKNKISFISKTDLASTEKIIIFETIDELINKLKEKL
jgi:thioredoxin-related protein